MCLHGLYCVCGGCLGGVFGVLFRCDVFGGELAGAERWAVVGRESQVRVLS